jgi:hypothetical protein
MIQPTMALILATIDGVKDARAGHVPWLWSAVTNPAHRVEILRSGWKSIWKVFLVAIVLDVVYQGIVHRFKPFYPGESVLVAAVLALVPYAVWRGPVSRIVRLFKR